MNIILDSGAFSAYTRKKEVNLKEYIEFIKLNKDKITHYISLDVIGDEKATWENQRIMESEGLTPLPIFHRHDSMESLERCMEYDYFCIGGVAGEPSDLVRVPFFNKCFKRICGENGGKPTRKIHGLGMTSFPFMRKYPFYSVDSTTWIMNSACGLIFVPRLKNGVRDYTQKPIKLNVSENPRNGKGEVLDTYPEPFKDYVYEYVKDMGYVMHREKTDDPMCLKNCYIQRAKLNVDFSILFNDHLPKYPWHWVPDKETRRLF